MKAMLKLHVPQVEIGQKGDRNPHWTTGAKRVWTISLMSGYSEVLKFGALSNPATIANLSRGQVSLPKPQTGVIVAPWNPSITKQVVQGSEATGYGFSSAEKVQTALKDTLHAAHFHLKDDQSQADFS